MIQPGELVVKRVRWQVGADLMGLVIGRDVLQEGQCWLVLWTIGDRLTEFKWHLEDALMVVDQSNIEQVRDRCRLAL